MAVSHSSEALIDLGVYAFDPDADAEPVADRGGFGPEWQRLRRALPRLRRVPPRRWLVGLLVPLLLTTVDSAPPRPALVPLWDAGGFLVASGDTAYGLEQAAGAATVTAYRLADGAVRWERRLPGTAWSGPDPLGDVLLLSELDERTHASVTAVDATTGQVRWSHEGRHLFTVDERWLLFTDLDVPPRDLIADTPGEALTPYAVAMVDARTGETAWTGWFGPREEPLPGATGHLLTMRSSGQLTRYDPATGAVLAVAGTAPVGEVGEGSPGPVTSVTGDGITVSVNWVRAPVASVVDDLVIVADRVDVVAYDVATLLPRWRVELATDSWAARCGTVVCLGSEGGALYGLDPVTGQVRWSRGCFQDLAAGPHPEAGTGAVAGTEYCRLLPPVPFGVPMLRQVTADGPEPVYSLIAVDETTGEPEAALTGWRTTGLRKGDRVLVTSSNLSSGSEAGRVWLGWWRPAARALEPLALVAAEVCFHLAGDYLLCGDDDPRTGGMIGVRVWRVD